MTSKKPDDQLMNRKLAAHYINRSYQTLSVWACRKKHLNPFKVNNKIRYRKSDLDRFLEKEPKRMK